MSVYSHMHFCLMGGPTFPKVESGAHPDLADVIDVTMRIGDASVTISGPASVVRGTLSGMLDAALRIVPLVTDAPKAPEKIP